MINHTFESAHALISSLKVGDWVRVQRDGEAPYEMYVSRGPRLADGHSGSPESLHVTVTFGPGSYATEVGVDHLWRRRRGHGFLGGGTTLEKISKPTPGRPSDDGDATGGGPYTPGSAIEEFGSED